MIGQKQLLARIKKQIKNNEFPRFSIITGPKGSGKKTIARDIIPTFFEGTDACYTLPDVKVDTIRQMISDSYKVGMRTFYIIPDADSMSLAAKNALLKVTEEPPNNAYFLMTLEDSANTLATIRSRGTEFKMDSYTPAELMEYANVFFKAKVLKEDGDIIRTVCQTPLDVQMLWKYGIQDFYNFVKLVKDNIAVVSGANAFKMAEKIAFKDEEDKYDLKLFLRAFESVCIEGFSKEPIKYAHGIEITSKYLQELRINGINKQALFDSWILDIRLEWM